MHPRRLFMFLAAAVLLSASIWPSLAYAAFPGANGKIAFVSDRYNDPGIYDIFLINPDGGGLVQLTSSGGDLQPRWSPGGTMLAFKRTVGSNSDIYRINADGSHLRRLTSYSGEDFEPSWSPDGSRIAFVSNRSGNRDIYTMTVDGGDVRRLTTSSSTDMDPSWSPDGTRIAFTSLRTGNAELYTMKADGSGATRLTSDAADDRLPSWEPSGARIAFTRVYADGSADIIVMNANGSGAINLTHSSNLDELSSWSPDGTKLIFDTNREGDFEVYFMNPDGSSPENLTWSYGDDGDPDWQPIPAFPLVDARFSTFNFDIQWLYYAGITKGCSDERFCSDDPVTRGQMAAFLDRGLSLPSTSTDYFTDDNSSIYQTDINRLAASGITKGCTATTFCPAANVTRGQMAAFLVRALGLPSTSTDYFSDDNGTTFEHDINALAAAGITKGCTPTTFCTNDPVTRGQMSAFLHRALG